VFNEHTDADGATVFRYACKLGLEGIVSKRLSPPYRSAPLPGLDHGEESVQPSDASSARQDMVITLAQTAPRSLGTRNP
jgi:hypothetical protein